MPVFKFSLMANFGGGDISRKLSHGTVYNGFFQGRGVHPLKPNLANEANVPPSAPSFPFSYFVLPFPARLEGTRSVVGSPSDFGTLKMQNCALKSMDFCQI